MRQQNLAQAMVRQMAAWGVKYIFGVTGDDLLPLLDALALEESPVFVPAAHEAGAAFMATAWSQLTGGLGVCAASAAGAVNLTEGLAAAYLDGARVLALTGQVDTPKIGTNVKQYFNQQGLVANFAIYTEKLTVASVCIRLLLRAMAQAELRQSVAHLSVPRDLWMQQVEAVPAARPPLFNGDARSARSSGDLERATGLMRQAKRPLVVVGRAARGLDESIRFLTEVWGAAVVVAQDAKGVLPDSWPQVVGGVGEAWLPELIAQVDCILLVGEASFEEDFLPSVAVIQLARYPWQVQETYLWDALAGDLETLINTLRERLVGYQIDNGWLSQIKAAKSQLAAIIYKDAVNRARPVHPGTLMAVLDRLVAVDAVLTIDEGGFNHWFDRNFRAQGQKVWISSRWRSMGAGLPAAVAAQLAYPDCQVIALVGDGGLLMSLGELTTVVRLRLPIKILVVTNHLYGLEKDKTLAKNFHPLGLEIPTPDFCACAQAVGIISWRVEDPLDLAPVLTRALNDQGPALVDIICGYDRLPHLTNN